MTKSKHMSRSTSLKSNIDYSLQLNRWFLKVIGIWSQINGSSKILVLLYIFICVILMACIMIPCTLFMLFEDANIKLKLGAVAPLLHRIMGWVNYYVLLRRSGDIRKLIRHMEADWEIINRIEDRKVMIQYAKFGRFVVGICGMFMHGSAFLFSVAKFLSTFIVNSSIVGGCSLAAVFATHACGQLNVLYTWLHELVENQKGNHVTERKMAVIVEHHLRVLSFIARVERIMNKISLVELMGCTMIMCLMGYSFLLALEDFDATKITSYINVYLSMAFNIFIYCYIGEIITERCKHVGEMAYMTDWYNLHHKTARGLVLIIARSNNVIKITAGKLFHLSVATFGDVIRTSMIYLNLLRTLTM
ncbi:odorant receptor 4-like isoform X3 [Temnothorax longispinosus]|uniref:odorant receptor 4-like isoform X3 n=1 Tax=Temnothorax longispinosus TaxID=300112 RepID=UPI003A9A0430